MYMPLIKNGTLSTRASIFTGAVKLNSVNTCFSFNLPAKFTEHLTSIGTQNKEPVVKNKGLDAGGH